MRFKLLLFCVLVALHAAARAAAPAAGVGSGELRNWCRDVTRAIPQIKLNTCISAELKPWARSVNGRHIMLHEFTPAQRPVARVMVVGGIHGDELTSVSIVFRW